MKLQVGDTVAFFDEFGQKYVSIVTRIVPKGEYSKNEEAYAIKGKFGNYVRVSNGITLVRKESHEDSRT